MPTVLASMRLGGAMRIVIGYAPYKEGKDEGTVTFYHGPLEKGIGITTLPDGEHGPLEEWTREIVLRGEQNGLSEIEPYLTEYDFVEPDEMPLWGVRAWIGRKRLSVRKGEMRGKEGKKMMKRIEAMEKEIRADEATMQMESARNYVQSITKRYGVK